MTDIISKLVDEIGPGHMGSTAYDTAWAARLGERDKVRIENGKLALERIVGAATQGLQSDPNGATVGFEMIAPTLAAEAEKLGIIKDQGNRILGRLSKLRTKKLSYLHDNMISRNVTMAFSAEMAGTDGRHMLDIENLQESNGSVGVSPSATAYFATYVKRGDEASLNYLRSVMKPDGGMPNVAPFDVFEIAWALWNLSFIPDVKKNGKLKPHIDFLSNAWQVKRGVGFAADYSVKDSDDTGLVYDTLLRFGCEKDLASVLIYEEKDHFRCFDLEANPSIRMDSSLSEQRWFVGHLSVNCRRDSLCHASPLVLE